MKFTINVEKKHLYVLALFVSILGIFTVFAAQPFNPNLGYHPLQQITVDELGVFSVDANFNGIIDEAENAGTLGGLNITQLTTQISSSFLWDISGNDIFYNGGKVGIGTSDPTEKLVVVGNILANKLIDLQDPSFKVNPAGTSTLNNLDVNSLSSGTATFNSITLGGTTISNFNSLSTSSANNQVITRNIYSCAESGGNKNNVHYFPGEYICGIKLSSDGNCDSIQFCKLN